MTHAQEPPAAGAVTPPPPPETEEPIPADLPRKFGANIWLSRLIPLSVAAALLAVVGIFLYNSSSAGTGKEKTIASLRQELSGAEAAAAEAKTRAIDLENRIARLESAKAQAQQDLIKLRTELQNANLLTASVESRAAHAAEQAARLQKELDQSQKINVQRQAQAEDLSANMAKLVREVDAKKDKNEQIRAELERTLAQYRQGIAQQNTAVAQYQALRLQYAALFESAQQAYLGAKAGQDDNLDARQAALKRSNLLKRLAPLRQQPMTEASRKALETSEVLLTRLGMVNPAAPGEVHGFMSLLKRSGVSEQIDAVLAGAVESEALRGWLFEAKMILG